MGSMLWASDMMLNDLIKPMTNAYQFKDYPTASNMLHQLNCFLLGYGEGIQNLPEPPKPDSSDGLGLNKRVDLGGTWMAQCKTYYEKHAPDVWKRIGKYIGDVIQNLNEKNQHYY